MQHQQPQQQTFDEHGRPIQYMETNQRAQPLRSPSSVMDNMWKADQIDRAVWAAFAGACMVGCQGNAELAAAAADQLYFQMWARANSQHV